MRKFLPPPPLSFCEFPNQTTRGEGGRKKEKKKSIADGHYDVAKRQGGRFESFFETGKQFIRLKVEKNIKGKWRGLGLAPWALIASGLVPRLRQFRRVLSARTSTGASWRKGEREKLETERKKEAREVGRAGRRRVLFYLFIYEGMGAKDCVKNETSSFTSNYTRDID